MAEHTSVMSEKCLQPRLLYPKRISFRLKGKIKCFTDKQKLEFHTTILALPQMLKEHFFIGNTQKRPTKTNPKQ